MSSSTSIPTLPPSASTDSRPPIKLKRGSVACKRCRRLRSKCTHDNAVAPCVSCKEAGPSVAAECTFPRRGEDASDREFRRKRVKLSDKVDRDAASRANVIPKTDNGSSATIRATSEVKNRWDLLPPYDEVVEGCKVFVTSFFQLGKSCFRLSLAVFLERLATDRDSVSVFLLLSILSISARFTPSLVRRYDDPVKATELFMSRAASLVPNEMYKPSLERTQSFFLLGIAEWGHGDRDRSFMHMGIAVRMAGLLRLHREETYRLPATPTADEIIAAEVARRTFWMIASQDNLQSAMNTPAAYSLDDISALLPCEEKDFAFGVVPRERAALNGTAAAAVNPSLTSTPSRSLFATLIQAHNLWGQVARRACQWENELPERSCEQRDDLGSQSVAPWDKSSEYAQLARALRVWEDELPERHRWSITNLRGYRAESLDLAYLAVVMVLRLSNIVMRRIYLPLIASAVNVSEAPWKEGEDKVWTSVPPNFWENMSHELFTNVLVCPHIAPHAEMILHRALSVLTDLQHAWPKAKTWQAALRKAAIPLPASTSSKTVPGMLTSDSTQQWIAQSVNGRPHPAEDQLPQAIHPQHHNITIQTPLLSTPISSSSNLTSPALGPAPPSNLLYELAVVATQGNGQPQPRPHVYPHAHHHTHPHPHNHAHSQTQMTAAEYYRLETSTSTPVQAHVHAHARAHVPGMTAFPSESFEAELASFLQGDMPGSSMMPAWDIPPSR
ncbi:hypothetical protein EW146_g1636 [Bondarzewia mesenterica]|uniref:Zn(2)-C6 fungal-type domain-containing protein n=1 Tax=Bondarzewia mesenterica TaxID=1095465 RepID=A0A4S4M5H0_9AGAM|nr:hypothetical protein EW146_g1636 [Bondarzewia mesenterica]